MLLHINYLAILRLSMLHCNILNMLNITPTSEVSILPFRGLFLSFVRSWRKLVPPVNWVWRLKPALFLSAVLTT